MEGVNSRRLVLGRLAALGLAVSPSVAMAAAAEEAVAVPVAVLHEIIELLERARAQNAQATLHFAAACDVLHGDLTAASRLLATKPA